MTRRDSSADAMLGRRTNSSTDAEEVAVQMQCWEKGQAATRMHRELSYGCSSGKGRAMGSNAEDVR